MLEEDRPELFKEEPVGALAPEPDCVKELIQPLDALDIFLKLLLVAGDPLAQLISNIPSSAQCELVLFLVELEL